MWKLFYVTGCLFVAIQNVEEWEEAIFNKSEGSVILKSFNLYTKILTLWRKGHEQGCFALCYLIALFAPFAVVAQLKHLRAVSVEEEKVRYLGKGYLVVLRFATGFSHPLTQSATLSGRRGNALRQGSGWKKPIVGTVAVSLFIIAGGLGWLYVSQDEFVTEVFVRQDEFLDGTKFVQVPCSEDYENFKRFKGCTPQRCGRAVTDAVISREEAGRMLRYFPDEVKDIFSEEDFELYRSLRQRIQEEIARTFGLDASRLYLTKPTFFSRMNNTDAKTIHDEYWHPHIDKVTYGSFDYTSLLYLSDYGVDFGGGRFVFMDGSHNRTVEPRAGLGVCWLTYVQCGRQPGTLPHGDTLRREGPGEGPYLPWYTIGQHPWIASGYRAGFDPVGVRGHCQGVPGWFPSHGLQHIHRKIIREHLEHI
ncbi:OGFD3 protein, partial [Polypterus senegalus]